MQQSNNPYKLRFHDEAEFIVFNKRSGFRTHRVNENQLGLVEVLSGKIKQELFVVHRLDKETSGLIVFAKTKSAAAELAKAFESRDVKKTYYFLTDQTFKNTSDSIVVKSHIDKIEKKFVNVSGKEDNSETKFTLSKKISESLYLWKAEPLTGKPHQIRLHAEKIGIPVLGDHEHGGNPWFRLALHAAEISFTFSGQVKKYSAALPYCFENPVVALGDFVTSEYFDLNQMMDLHPEQTYRLYHRSNQEQEIRADLYGKIIWVYWYKKDPPTESDLTSLADFCKKHNLDYVVRHMINRGTGVGGKEQNDLYYSTAPEKWTAQEHSLICELRRDQGFSPGLFLDQRDNRQLIYENAKGKTVLNLFSYTSLFSVAAGVGGARHITTVDASRTFLDWSKENFILNKLDPEKHEFFAQDSLLFLEGSIKRNRKWDVIICDPPSFGRTKTTTWKLDKDFPQLAKAMWNCLNGKGIILFTCNFEKWSLNDIQKQFEKALPKGQFKFQELPIPDLDFEFPDAFDNLLKGILVRKN